MLHSNKTNPLDFTPRGFAFVRGGLLLCGLGAEVEADDHPRIKENYFLPPRRHHSPGRRTRHRRRRNHRNSAPRGRPHAPDFQRAGVEGRAV